MNDRFLAAVEGASWLESAADLLAEADPGPTPWLVDELLVAGAIGAVQGAPKTSKTWLVLELAVAIATGRPAFGRFEVPAPGPVVLVLEESGRAALHRRLGALARGNAIRPDALADIHFAANRRVRLDSDEWQIRLTEAVQQLQPAAVILDPLARMKQPGRDENAQTEMAPLLDFMRALRDVNDPAPAVVFVHHTGHDGAHLRGSSDLESYWESKIALTRSKTERDEYAFEAEHREAEAGQTHRFRQAWDIETRSLRLRLLTDELDDEVRAFLATSPEASANEIVKALGGNRQAILAAVSRVRSKVVPASGNHLEPPPPEPAEGGSGEGGSPPVGGSPSGTTALPPVPDNGTHPSPDELPEGWLARSLKEEA